jgi:hypothetical protein
MLKKPMVRFPMHFPVPVQWWRDERETKDYCCGGGGGENMQKVLCASHAAASFYSAKGLLQGQWWSRS